MASTFLVLAYGEAGHALPMLSLVEGLTRRGHRALVYISEKFKDGVAAAGGEYLAPRTFSDPFEHLKQMRARAEKAGRLGALRGFLKARSSMGEGVAQMTREFEEVIRAQRVDCVLASFTVFGARYAAARTGCAFASVGPNPLMLLNERGGMVLTPHPFMKYLPTQAVHSLMDLVLPMGKGRERLDLPEWNNGLSELMNSVLSDSLHLITVHESFFPEARHWPGQLCVGPTSFNLPRPGARPFPVESLAPGTVLVSTTTMPMDGGLFRRTLEALAPLGIPLLATAAGAQDLPEGLGSHVRLESFVPHDQVLPHVSALVTHGGWGITGRALRQGVPMLITPLFGDQPVIASRLAERGLAYQLTKKQATKEAIQNALSALLEDRALHQRVAQEAERLRSIDSPRIAAEALEQLVARRAPQRSAA